MEVNIDLTIRPFQRLCELYLLDQQHLPYMGAASLFAVTVTTQLITNQFSCYSECYEPTSIARVTYLFLLYPSLLRSHVICSHPPLLSCYICLKHPMMHFYSVLSKSKDARPHFSGSFRSSRRMACLVSPHGIGKRKGLSSREGPDSQCSTLLSQLHWRTTRELHGPARRTRSFG